MEENDQCPYDNSISCGFCAWAGKCTCDEYKGPSEQNDDDEEGGLEYVSDYLNDALGG